MEGFVMDTQRRRYMSIEQEIIESLFSPILPFRHLEEVWRGHPGRNDPLGVGDGLEEFGLALVHVAVGKLEDGGDVAASVAIVWCGPHCHQLIVEHVLVTFVGRKEGNDVIVNCNEKRICHISVHRRGAL